MAGGRENWSGNIGFVLAAAGSAIGLGNIWKFPYVTGMNGGGAFVLVYLVCIILIGMPVMIAEFAIGRNTGKNPYGAFAVLQKRYSHLAGSLAGAAALYGISLLLLGRYGFGIVALAAAALLALYGFKVVGALAVVLSFVILSYYAVVGGWALAFVWKSFTGFDAISSGGSGEAFKTLAADPAANSVCFAVFMLLAALVVFGGVRSGIERWSKILMPTLFLLLIAVIIRSLTLPGAGSGVEFFLKPDFSKLSAAGLLEALGHAFYTLSLGMGIAITYGSYLGRRENLFGATFSIICLDTMAAVMAGLAIFPAVFAMGFQPSQGPGLIFVVLPSVFGHFPGNFGFLWSGLFFVMISIAALTSAVSLFEVVVSFAIDQFKWPRRFAAPACFAAVTLAGLLSAASSTDWVHLEGIRRMLEQTFGAEYVAGSFFDVLDKIASNWLLPLSGMMTALFVGWVWGSRAAARELRRGSAGFCDQNLFTLLADFNKDSVYRASGRGGLTLITLWAILLRFVAPFIILLVFLQSVGVNLGLGGKNG